MRGGIENQRGRRERERGVEARERGEAWWKLLSAKCFEGLLEVFFLLDGSIVFLLQIAEDYTARKVDA
jgi:hypothetical protein